MAVAIGVCLPTILQADDIAPAPPAKVYFMLLADTMSAQYHISPYAVKYVLKHESEYDPNKPGDHGLANGVAQYHRQTFNQYEGYYFKATGMHLNYGSSEDQIKLMAWQWSNYPESKKLWSTYRDLHSGKKIV